MSESGYQIRMPRMPIPITEGCPHRHGRRSGVDRCDMNEMRPCIYENGNGPCDIFPRRTQRMEGGIFNQ